MLIKVFGAAVQGIDATLITIEVNSSRGCMFYLVGLPDSAVKESHQRIISALQVNGYRMPTSNIVINMAPADIRKEGSAYDLPLAIGMLGASEVIRPDKLNRYLLMGELSLDGSLQPIKGALPIAIKARELGFEGIIIPKQNTREAAVVNNLKVYGAGNLKEVIEFFNDKQELELVHVDTRKEFYTQQNSFDLDFSDVKGQENVKRALEVAAAGGHNILLVGAPGSGKSMLAKRLPSILPPLSLGESLETTKIHSVAGKLEQVKCPVAVFVNRQYREGAMVSFVLGGMIDAFLFSYLEKMLQNGHSIRLFLFDTDDEEFRGCIDDLQARYPGQMIIVWFEGVEDLVTKEKDGLLIMSHLSYTKLSEDEAVMRELSSLLVIRRNKNTGDKNEGLEN